MINVHDENPKYPSLADRVEVWLTFPDTINDPALLAAYAQLLNAEEQQRWQRFHFAKHRKQYLVSHALVRTMLSRFAPQAAEAWRFITNDYGRPEIVPEENPNKLHFNLSHTDGLIACAVSQGRELGVDVEDMARNSQTVEIADRFFATQECHDLRALPVAQQHARFFDYWTLKESYIKARGMGLSLPLEQFSFHINDAASIGISFGPKITDRPERWHFWQWQVGPQHKLALCVEQETSEKLSLAINKNSPLIGTTLFSCTLLRESS